jgi:hypothetical protein
MSLIATCSNVFHATGTGGPGTGPTPPAVAVRSGVAEMTVDRVDQELMTRRQVACLLRVTSAAVASWARRGRLAEVRNEAGKPRYRRADVEALLRAGSRRNAR